MLESGCNADTGLRGICTNRDCREQRCVRCSMPFRYLSLGTTLSRELPRAGDAPNVPS